VLIVAFQMEQQGCWPPNDPRAGHGLMFLTQAQRDAELTQLNGKLYTVAKPAYREIASSPN